MLPAGRHEIEVPKQIGTILEQWRRIPVRFAHKKASLSQGFSFIAGERSDPISDLAVPIVRAVSGWPSRGKIGASRYTVDRPW
jgi:hypothetical protein